VFIVREIDKIFIAHITADLNAEYNVGEELKGEKMLYVYCILYIAL
jgi:hypothetical protein